MALGRLRNELELKAWVEREFGDTFTTVARLRQSPATLATALPADPGDGQEVNYVADAAAGILWRLRYRAASGSAYKWEFLGGSPLLGLVATSQTTTSLTYADLATVGPDVTVPLAGDYVIESGARQGSDGADFLHMSYSIGAVAATDADEVLTHAAANLEAQMAARVNKKTSLAAGTLLRAKYRAHFAGRTGTWGYRYLSAVPVRVG